MRGINLTLTPATRYNLSPGGASLAPSHGNLQGAEITLVMLSSKDHHGASALGNVVISATNHALTLSLAICTDRRALAPDWPASENRYMWVYCKPQMHIDEDKPSGRMKAATPS